MKRNLNSPAIIDALKAYLNTSKGIQPDVASIREIKPELADGVNTFAVVYYSPGSSLFDIALVVKQSERDGRTKARHRLAAFNAFVNALKGDQLL